MMFCPECGSKSEENALFCINCGTKLNDAGDQQIIDSGQNETATFDNEKEHFKERAFMQLDKGKWKFNTHHILYFTNRNIYMTEVGMMFIRPDGKGFAGGRETEDEINMEKEAPHMDFRELVAGDPDIIIIPYDEIINITLPKKKKMLKVPTMSIVTSSEAYNFYFSKWADHKYKDKVERYLHTIAPLFGDKVTIE